MSISKIDRSPFGDIVVKTEKSEYISSGKISRETAEELVNAWEAVQRVVELHKPVNGPYDDLSCETCTDYLNIYAGEISSEPAYVEYPCPTIEALDGETK
jgi:hypothetical protein